MATFRDEDLYDTIPKKAGALAFSLVRNHAFVDGNKRIGQAGMEVFLTLNGFTISADVDEQEDLLLSRAAGDVSREMLQVRGLSFLQHVGFPGGVSGGEADVGLPLPAESGQGLLFTPESGTPNEQVSHVLAVREEVDDRFIWMPSHELELEAGDVCSCGRY